MRDKVLKRAILISIAVHLVALGLVGRTCSTRLNTSSVVSAPQRLLNVDLVKDPLADPPKPAAVVRHEAPPPEPKRGPIAAIANLFGNHRSDPAPAPPRANPKAGGALNTGTNDSHGDLAGNWNGKTSVGRVPGPDNGSGNGSGNEAGVGTPEPVRPDPPRHQDPPPPPPPVPKRLTVRVCEVSGMLPGKYCERTHEATYNEGDEPRRTCDRCRAPEPKPEPAHVSRVADITKPIRLSKVNPNIPASVEEGQTFHLEIEFYSDADGGVSEVRVTQSSGNRAVDRAVVADALKWRFKPATQDGVAQRVKVVQPVTVNT